MISHDVDAIPKILGHSVRTILLFDIIKEYSLLVTDFSGKTEKIK